MCKYPISQYIVVSMSLLKNIKETPKTFESVTVNFPCENRNNRLLVLVHLNRVNVSNVVQT